MSFLKSAAALVFGGKMTNLRGSSSVGSISGLYSSVKAEHGSRDIRAQQADRQQLSSGQRQVLR